MNDTSICHFPTAVRSGWCWSLMRFKQRWKSFRGSFEMKCLRVRRQREPTHKLLNVSLKSDMMFASNVWPFPGNFGFWKPYYLHTMDRLWSTSGTWDGFSQLTFLLQISPIPTCISRCNISDSYEVVWILPVLTVEIFWWFVSRGNTLRLTKNRVPHTGVVFVAWSIGVPKNRQIRCQAAGAAAVMTTSLPKRVAAAPSPSFLGMFFFLFMSSWMILIRDEILLCVYRSSWKVRVIFGYPKKDGPDFERGSMNDS